MRKWSEDYRYLTGCPDRPAGFISVERLWP
jgi:hypothetical protein